eukprot:NODE_697_length_5080_cov_0.072877.p1 type:complete len:831 gc:universal NODE_697_length_5080_cov_0.072877:296-2788(+)
MEPSKIREARKQTSFHTMKPKNTNENFTVISNSDESQETDLKYSEIRSNSDYSEELSESEHKISSQLSNVTELESKPSSSTSDGTEFFDAREDDSPTRPLPPKVRVQNPTSDDISPKSSISNASKSSSNKMSDVLMTETTANNSSLAALEILINTADQFTPMELIGYTSLVCILLNEMSTNYAKKVKESTSMFWGNQKTENLAFESADAWSDKIRQKMFKHLQIESVERQMIKNMTTHDVKATDIADMIIPQEIKDKIIWEREFNYNKSKLEMMEDFDYDIEQDANDQDKKEENYYQPLDDNQVEDEDNGLECDPISPKTGSPEIGVPKTFYKPSERKDLQDITKFIEPDSTDIRHVMLTDLFLTLISEYSYDARSRALLFRLSRLISVPKSDVLWIERVVAHKLKYLASLDDNKEYSKQDLEARENKDKTKRYVAIGLASIAGGITIGVSGGLAAPLLAVGLTKLGLAAGGSAFLGSTAGGLAVGGGTGIVGSIMGSNAMAKRTKNITNFEFYTVLHEQQVSLTISIGGWLSVGDTDDSDIALPFFPLAPEEGDHVSLMWESTMLRELGSIFKILASEVISSTVQQALALTMMSSFVAFLSWPIALSKLAYVLDNPWSNALDRSQKAGYLLADKLIRQFQDGRPISLIGYSLGARVIYFCLEELHRNHAFGIVENVYMVGCPVTANKSQWEIVSTVVSGRFVNGYARNDWILGYLFRATSGGVFNVAGLGGINISGIENVDISDIVDGHMMYRVNMPRIMKRIGLSVTNEQLSLVYKKDKQFRERKSNIVNLDDDIDTKIKNIVNEAAKNESELEIELARLEKDEKLNK